MKTGIPLCFAFLSLYGQSAAAAPGGQVPSLWPDLRITDNGAQGMRMTLDFQVAAPFVWLETATATYSLSDSGTVIGSGNLQFRMGWPHPAPTFPITYARYASGNPYNLQFDNVVGINATGRTIFPVIVPGFISKRTLTVTGGTAAEGNTGTTQVPFTVAIDKAIGEPLTFNYVSSGGTATAGQDYTPVLASGAIPAGQLSTTVNVPVKADTINEAHETLGLEITGTGAVVLRGTDTMATIQNDDAAEIPAPAPALVVDVASAGTLPIAWFSVNLTQPGAAPITCRVATRDGSAKAGSDYRALAPANITFAAGETQKWVSITVTPAPEVESREEFFLDVEEVQSHTVKSAACIIEPFAITGIVPDPVEQGVYRLTFPAGQGQRCIIEESASLTGTWTLASNLLTGAGALLEQKVYPSTPRGFFRLRPISQADPGTAAAGS